MIFRSSFLSLLVLFSFLTMQVKAESMGHQQMSRHEKAGRTNICDINFPEHFEVLVNWGTKPEWIDSSHFVFLSNQVGDVYLMDIASREIKNLTGHFHHAGFTRAFKLNNGDLLLLGPEEGPQPPEDPLILYDKGQFTGELWVLKKPYDGMPIPLGVYAWEGIAVSRETNRIAWSDTFFPFYESNIFATGWSYFFKRSNIMTGLIEYDKHGVPSISHPETLLAKWRVGPVSLEPQNFRGKNDEELLLSSYGPFENLSSLLSLDMKTKRYSRVWDCFTYREWEGVNPDYTSAFVEINTSHALLFSGLDFVELYLYHFNQADPEKRLEQITFFERDHHKSIGLHEPAFSEDGKQALMTVLSATDPAPSTPGYGFGIVLFDYVKFRQDHPH